MWNLWTLTNVAENLYLYEKPVFYQCSETIAENVSFHTWAWHFKECLRNKPEVELRFCHSSYCSNNNCMAWPQVSSISLLYVWVEVSLRWQDLKFKRNIIYNIRWVMLRFQRPPFDNCCRDNLFYLFYLFISSSSSMKGLREKNTYTSSWAH